MIEYVTRIGPDGITSRPAIICDFCGNPVVGHGTILWFARGPHGYAVQDVSPLHAVHKGRCDDRLTASVAHLYPHSQGWVDQSQEVSYFLANLADALTDPGLPGAIYRLNNVRPDSWGRIA